MYPEEKHEEAPERCEAQQRRDNVQAKLKKEQSKLEEAERKPVDEYGGQQKQGHGEEKGAQDQLVDVKGVVVDTPLQWVVLLAAEELPERVEKIELRIGQKAARTWRWKTEPRTA